MAKSGRAKGLLFNYLKEWAVARHGQHAWNTMLESVGDGERNIFRGLTLAMSWHDIAAWNRICDAFFQKNYADPDVGMAEFCGDLGERELTTMVKLVLKLGSPEFMLKRTSFLWARYFDAGEFGAEELTPGHWRLWLEDVADAETSAGRLTCANGPGPWLERGLVLSGNPGSVKHVTCRYDGNPHCEFEATWTV